MANAKPFADLVDRVGAVSYTHLDVYKRQVFLGGLTNAMGYRIEEGNLLIDMLYESGTLVFVPAQQ